MESLETINKRLFYSFGRFEDGRPIWRVVWSDGQFEKRWVTHTPEGLELINPIVEEVPKYSYIKHRYVLERLIPVLMNPALNELVTKTSYEPVWTFEDKNGNALPPIWEAVFLLIRTVQTNLESAGHNAPYKLPEEMGNTKEAQKFRADKLYAELFGDETTIGDSLALDTAVGFGERKRSDWTH